MDWNIFDFGFRWVCEKTDSPGYDTPVSKTIFILELFSKMKILLFNSRIWIHIYFCDTVSLKACAKVYKEMAIDSPGSWVTLRSWYPGEIDSAQYDTPGRFL